jgi:Arginase family
MVIVLANMHLILKYVIALAIAGNAIASPTQKPLHSGHALHNTEKYDLNPAATYAFAGITTFHQLPSSPCLTTDGGIDDILVVGFPFDTATSYRSGTRFGPNAIRQGSRAASLA